MRSWIAECRAFYLRSGRANACHASHTHAHGVPRALGPPALFIRYAAHTCHFEERRAFKHTCIWMAGCDASPFGRSESDRQTKRTYEYILRIRCTSNMLEASQFQPSLISKFNNARYFIFIYKFIFHFKMLNKYLNSFELQLKDMRCL